MLLDASKAISSPKTRQLERGCSSSRTWMPGIGQMGVVAATSIQRNASKLILTPEGESTTTKMTV